MKKIIFSLAAIAVMLVSSYFIFKVLKQKQAHNLQNVEVNAAEKDNDTLGIKLPPPTLLYGINVDSLEVFEGVIKRDENLASILYKFNVSPKEIAQIADIPDDVFNVRKIKANKPYTVIHKKDTQKTAKYFVYQPNPIDYIKVEFGDSVRASLGKNKVDTIMETLTGRIEYSLYQTIIDSGASPLLVNSLADIYAWEIDFFGLQKGDLFKMFYERYEVNGESAGLGPIYAAWFEHMGENFYAVRYDQGEGPEYFDVEGKSLRKTFLKAPLNFSRISSRFSYSRLHPILKIRRPHLGVDYAAPRGTPVVAVGDGVVTKAAYSGGGGNMVKIKHNSNYNTAYLHLWKYGKGIKRGVYVKQGQVIGYVGSTGLSTGPHLDFRFYKNGKPVDPLKIDPPSANPIKEEVMSSYLITMKKWKKKLDSLPIVQPNHDKPMLSKAGNK